MSEPEMPRILVVDDEEAILETMVFTFEGEYEVLTSTDARRALELLDQRAPVAVVLTDQRMPYMSGVEFLAEVCRRHPATVRIILTGFADMDAIIDAINDGHVYAYITKPWEPDQLKQVVKQAIERYELTVENERLLANVRRANVFLEAVMDELDVGAIALDGAGVVQALNRPVRRYLGLEGDIRGQSLKEVLVSRGLEQLGGAAYRLAHDDSLRYDDVEVSGPERCCRLRVSVRNLSDEVGSTFGRVILLREISHEPLQRRFNDIISGIIETRGGLRARLEEAREQLRKLASELEHSQVESPGLAELSERQSRTLTAIENWLDVDDTLAREGFPDVQLLQDRMRVASARWPLPDELPERVRELARRVEEYYESGENPKQRVL